MRTNTHACFLMLKKQIQRSMENNTTLMYVLLLQFEKKKVYTMRKKINVLNQNRNGEKRKGTI